MNFFISTGIFLFCTNYFIIWKSLNRLFTFYCKWKIVFPAINNIWIQDIQEFSPLNKQCNKPLNFDAKGIIFWNTALHLCPNGLLWWWWNPLKSTNNHEFWVEGIFAVLLFWNVVPQWVNWFSNAAGSIDISLFSN